MFDLDVHTMVMSDNSRTRDTRPWRLWKTEEIIVRIGQIKIAQQLQDREMVGLEKELAERDNGE